MKYLNPSPERFEKILNILPLKYIRHQRSHYLMDNYMHRAICLFQIGRYREAIRLLEDGRVKVPRNEPDILWFHDYVYPVMRGLLSLKMSDRSPETLVNDLKSPAKFEITLKAFKRFDCPPMYAFRQCIPRNLLKFQKRQQGHGNCSRIQLSFLARPDTSLKWKT